MARLVPLLSRKVPTAPPREDYLLCAIQQHLESFLDQAHESTGKLLPKYVENEFRRYLECGLHAHGFARAVCDGRMRFVEVIEDVGRARSELRRRNLPAEPPPLARARAPDGDD